MTTSYQVRKRVSETVAAVLAYGTKLSQAELGKRWGMSQANVSKILNGQSAVKFEDWERFQRIFSGELTELKKKGAIK